MILDTWNNRSYYANTHPLFPDAFSYIEEYLKNPMMPGIYEIRGKDLFAKVQEYETRTAGYLEVHDEYIDIQFMVEGTERVEYADRDNLEPAMPYDEKEDALFLKDCHKCLSFDFNAGSFAIFFPGDAHKPAMCVDAPKLAKKVVLKVKL